MRSLLRFILWLAAATAALAPSLAAADPPARVGRLALIEGPVLFRTDREDAGRPATLNWPISTGAILDTDAGARAEVWIGSSTYRLAGRSRLEFATVDDRLIFLQLATGTLAITIRDREQADTLELRTPEGRIQFGRAGRYRIDVAAGRTTVTSRSGIAYAYGSGRPLPVPEGRSAVIDVTGEGTLYGELPADAFDSWASARDAARDGAVARRYVSPEMTGYEDLDPYGDWDTVVDYGVVWYPRHVPTGWAPYRHGRWAWVAPWGWTWIDEAPWGFAPFHYGRWAVIGGRWGWVPGSFVARPVYAPALVVWLGGSDWSVGVGTGPAVGWFPLGPREVFVPPYRATTPYLHSINTPHVPDRRHLDKVLADQGGRRFSNQTVPQAVTVAPLRLLGEGRPVAGAMLRPDHREIGRLPASIRPPGMRDAPASGARVPLPEGMPTVPAMTTPERPAPFPGRTAPAAPPVRAQALPPSPGRAIADAVTPPPQSQRQQAAPPPAPRPEAESPAMSPQPAPWRRESEPPAPAVVPARPAPPPVTMQPVQPMPAPAARPPETVAPRLSMPPPGAGGMPATVAPPRPMPRPEAQVPVREGWRNDPRPGGEMPLPRPMGGPPAGGPPQQGGRFLPMPQQ